MVIRGKTRSSAKVKWEYKASQSFTRRTKSRSLGTVIENKAVDNGSPCNSPLVVCKVVQTGVACTDGKSREGRCRSRCLGA
eukprot:2619884-Amphidinium_carterae.1